MEDSTDRPHSSAAGQFMNRSATVLSSWGDQSVRAEELNRRLVSSMKKTRVRTPPEWFEKQYENIAERDAAAKKKTDALIEARRQKCLDFAVSRRRTLERLQSDIRPQQEAEREELARVHGHRMTAADSRVADKKERMDAAILGRRQQHEQDVKARQKFWVNAQRMEEKRAARLQSFAEPRVENVRRARERRLSEGSEKAQRRHALQVEASKVREYGMRQQQQQSEAAMERQHGLSEWLRDLDHQKKTTLRQRRISGMRSSLERQSILQQSYDQWHEKLRETPLPTDPEELSRTAERMAGDY